MSKLKKKVQKRDLGKIKTWIVDENPFSEYFRLTQIPDILPGGKSGFLINGSPNLVRTTEVLVEIIDADGNTIFLQPIKNYNEGLARVISIEVYEDTPPGPATLTILGELAFDKSKVRVPGEWVGTYNVKWQKIINVDPLRPNSTPIRLYNKPVLSVTEHLHPFRQSVTGSLVSQSSGILVGQYVPGGIQFIGDDPSNQQRIVTRPYTNITNTASIFNKNASEGTIEAVINGYPFTSSFDLVTNTTTARLRNIFTGTTGLPEDRWEASSYVLKYRTSPTFITSSLVRSFAEIQLSNLTTFTGDIQRAKFYIKGVDLGQKYQILDDVALENTNLIVSHSTLIDEVDLGQIENQSFIDQNWEDGTIINGTTYSNSGDVTASYSSTELMDALFLSGTIGSLLYTTGAIAPVAWAGISQSISMSAEVEYNFSADITCVKSNSSFDGRMEIYLSGSTIGNQLGYRIADLQVPTGQLRRSFYNHSVNFVAPSTDIANLRFVMYGGEWHISNVRLRSSRETGFNPDELTIKSPVVGRRFERLQFKAELYDANSNLVPLNIETDPIYFDGGNLVFRGGDTRVDGVITVAPSGSGPTLTSKGFFNISGTFVDGQAIFIGPLIPTVRNKNTAFFAGTSSAGPEFSVGDKLYGYYDYPSDQFILEINGIIKIGSGSTFVDIRSLLANNSSVHINEYITGSGLDFFDVRGRGSVNAGSWFDQIGRMGNYVRGYDGFTSQSQLVLSPITTQINPFQLPTQSVTLYTSGSISVAQNKMFFNNTLYTSASFQLSQLNMSGSMVYRMNYVIDVINDWSGPPSTASLGQILLTDSALWVASSGTLPIVAINDYPIFVQPIRTSNTLHVLLRMNITTYPST